jgi:hypothetical protein
LRVSSQIGTATHRWVKMVGSDRVQTMQMQAASGCGIRLLYAYVCTWTTLSHCTAASRDLPARHAHKEHTYLRVFCISSYPMSISRPARSPRPRPRGHGYHTLPAGLNDNNNGILLSSGQTVVALTHVMVNPPSRSSESARVRVAVLESKSRQK